MNILVKSYYSILYFLNLLPKTKGAREYLKELRKEHLEKQAGKLLSRDINLTNNKQE